MVYHEIQHWWYFGQNCILFYLPVLYLNVIFITTSTTFHLIFRLLTNILKCDFKNYQDYFLIESFRYVMPQKYNSKRKRPESSKSLDQSNKAKSLKELEIPNEVIYNMKHSWMRRVLIDFINDRFLYIWMVIHVIPTIGCSTGGF